MDRELTRGVIDGGISNQSAATLQDLDISYCQPYLNDDVGVLYELAIAAVDILRLVQGGRRPPRYAGNGSLSMATTTKLRRRNLRRSSNFVMNI